MVTVFEIKSGEEAAGQVNEDYDESSLRESETRLSPLVHVKWVSSFYFLFFIFSET